MSKQLKRRNVVDPAVAEILSDMDRKKRFASLPKARREKARKDASRHKVGLDLPPELHEALRQVAEKEQISISGLVAFFAHLGLESYRSGEIDLFPFKRVSRSARFEFVLEIPDK
jgi:hypothetical protein